MVEGSQEHLAGVEVGVGELVVAGGTAFLMGSMMTELEDQRMETLNMSGLSNSYPVFSLYSHHHFRQSSDTSWGRPGEGKVEQQWGRKDRRGDRQVQERQVHEKQEMPVQDLRVQLQGGQRTVVDQEESLEGPVPDLRSKLSQRRGEGGNKDLREDLNNRRAAGGGGEEGDERPLSPREQQRKAAAEERERLRNRARGGGGGGGGGQQRGGSGGQQRGGKGPGGGNQHQQQGRGGGQHQGGRQNGRGGEHEVGSRVQVNNHQNGVHHEPQQQHGKQGGGKQQIPRPKKNTENFNPSHEAPPMR